MDKKFKDSIKKEFKNKYESIVGDKFDEFLKNIEPNIEVLEDELNRENVYKKIEATIKITKARWIDKEIKNDKSALNNDINYLKEKFKAAQNNDEAKKQLQKSINCKTYSQYKKNIYKELDEWKNILEMPFTKFKYFLDLNKKSKKAGFKYDILIKYYNYLKSDNNYNVKRIPSVFGDIPIDPTNRKRLFNGSVQLTDDISIIDSILYSDQERKDRLIVMLEQDTYLRLKEGKSPVDLVTQIALLKATKAMNDIDKKVTTYYYTYFFENVMVEKCENYIYEIAANIGFSNNKKNNEAIEDALKKLGSLNLQYDIAGNSINGSIIDTFIYLEEETGKKMARVHCGPFLKDLILMNSSYNFNKEAYDSISSDAQHYALWFQKRRINLVAQNKESEEIPIGKVLSAILWNTKRFDRQLKRITEVMEDLKGAKLIIKEYSYDKKLMKLFVKYIKLPIKIQEKIRKKEFKAGEFIEGSNTEYTIE